MDNRFIYSSCLIVFLAIFAMGQAGFQIKQSELWAKLTGNSPNSDPYGEYCYNNGVNVTSMRFKEEERVEIKSYPSFYAFKRSDYQSYFKGHYTRNEGGIFITHHHISSFGHEKITPMFTNGPTMTAYYYQQNLYSKRDCPKVKDYTQIKGQNFLN